jgi:hypothetical protein
MVKVMKSSEFVQFNFPCADCLVRAACKEQPKNEVIKHLYDKNAPRCLAIPELPPDVAYIKGLLECWANLGATIINNMQKSEDPHTSMETHSKIPMQYIMLMGQMAYLFQWIVNSTSWDLGILQGFDKQEIRIKCKGITL